MKVKHKKVQLDWEFQWLPHPIVARFSLCDIGYERLKLCRVQHTITFVILGLGLSLNFWTGRPCSKKQLAEIWGEDEPDIKPKKLSTRKPKKRKG